MQRSSVDLPPPEGPMMATTSPGLTASEMSRRTSSSPKLFFAWLTATTGAEAAETESLTGTS